MLCVDAVKRCSTKSSSFVFAPFIPFPPRLCVFQVSTGSLLMYPLWVIVTIISSSAIISSRLSSPLNGIISVRLLSPCLSSISFNSFSMISLCFSWLSRMWFSFLINSCSSRYSCTTLSISNDVSF